MPTIHAARKLMFFTALALICCLPLHSQQTHNQLVFCAECEIKHPIAVPNAALEILKKDQLVQETLKDENLSLEQLPDSWFIASEIALGPAEETDYLVQGQQFLVGAHATHFWIFRETPSGMKLVLQAFADGLTTSGKRYGHFRIIETNNLTAVSFVKTYYRFLGDDYRQFRQERGKL
jgi:hypothetical protein